MKLKPAIYFLLVSLLGMWSCTKDEERSCSTCENEQTSSFELCKEINENASVNGKDTGTDYDVYLSNLKDEGVECGG